MQSLTAPLSGPVARPPAVALRLVSDARLARLAAAGSEGAMAAIFERHHQALKRYCHSILGNGHDAADALQNTMIKALRALPGENRQIALRPWLYRIAHNESVSLLRARRADSDLDAAVHVSDAGAAGAVESRERLRSLTEDLGELTERQRGALLMRELGGLEFTEVADALGTNASAVKQSVYEARCALQAMQEGRAMKCEAIRRTLSDGDRRMLRGMRMRGHLRACAGCRDFEVALHQRPAQLTAMIPPMSVAAAAAMLQGLLGGGSTGGGGGLAVTIAGTAKTATGFSFGAKAAAVVAASAGLAGGAAYSIPKLESAGPERSLPRAERVVGASMPGLHGSIPRASSSDGAGIRDATKSADAGKPAGTPAGGPSDAGKPAGTPAGGPSDVAKPAGTPAGGPSDAGKPAGTPAGGPSEVAKPAGTPAGGPSDVAKPAETPAGSPSVGAPGASAVVYGRP